MPDDAEVERSGADRAYEWTIRLLYIALIAGEVVLAYNAWKDTATGIEWRAKVRARTDRFRHCAGCQRRKEWLRDRAHMLWEATEIVENAQAQEEGPA